MWQSNEAVKTWLREDTTLIRKNIFHALPMGYLITGRIGTGKTFIVQCWAGELGIPCLVFKNFRDRWVGATESNLEKIFSILHALGQVLVLWMKVQAAGKRDGGDGDAPFRTHLWHAGQRNVRHPQSRTDYLVFATSRPDLLEVDLNVRKADAYSAFAPQGSDEMRVLFCAVQS
jgi:hypothetical protein